MHKKRYNDGYFELNYHLKLFIYVEKQSEMENQKFTSYLNSLSQWMLYYGFQEIPLTPEYQIDKVFTRSRAEVTKFSQCATYCFIKYVKEGVDGNWLAAYSSNMYTFAYQHRQGMPVGIGASLVVYPLLVMENVNQEIVNFLYGYQPKHYSAFEFPSILDLQSNNLYFMPNTPVWGALFYKGFREEVYKFFSSKSWTEVSQRLQR